MIPNDMTPIDYSPANDRMTQALMKTTDAQMRLDAARYRALRDRDLSHVYAEYWYARLNNRWVTGDGLDKILDDEMLNAEKKR